MMDHLKLFDLNYFNVKKNAKLNGISFFPTGTVMTTPATDCVYRPESSTFAETRLLVTFVQPRHC